MKPYYDDGQITIYHGDCREILPTLEPVDLVLTDPPYGIGRDGKPSSTSSHGGHKGYEFMGWDTVRPDYVLFEAMLKTARDCIIWGGQYFADMLPPQKGWLIWDKGQRIDQADAEIAWTTRVAPVRIWTLNRVALAVDGAVHPTQKPVSLMRWCLEFFPNAQTILDPFMGSGTTLRAAKDLGRRAIGIEIEERYCEAAVKRLAQEVLPLGFT
jgi:DNA modification methylase